jgi:GR25 family glycosyltransferase involved in LPS biosynthesis
MDFIIVYIMSYLKKFFSIVHLYLRWVKRNINDFFNPKEHLDISFDSLEFVYINLDHRKDRKFEIESEFHKLGIKNFKRFSAIKNSFGALGCALSHESVLKDAKYRFINTVVCEDDATFLVNRETLENIVSEFYKDSRLDVLCLAYNEFNKIHVSSKFYISSNIQTMAFYLAKPYVLHDLCNVAKKSIYGLENGGSEEVYAIDQVWKTLQQKYIFCIPFTRAVQQRPSYSDIRSQEVNYGA